MLLSPDFCFFLGRCRSCASEIERLCTGIPMISALSNIGLLNWSLRVASRSQTTTPCVSETCHRFMINAGRCAFPKAPRGSWSSSPLPSLSVAASAMSKTQSSRLRRLAAVLATMLSCLLPPGRAFGMRGTKATLVASSPSSPVSILNQSPSFSETWIEVFGKSENDWGNLLETYLSHSISIIIHLSLALPHNPIDVYSCIYIYSICVHIHICIYTIIHYTYSLSTWLVPRTTRRTSLASLRVPRGRRRPRGTSVGSIRRRSSRP